MPSPILHSLAQGIHPASFVQDAEPSPAQDGTEWTDTSAGPPYVRKVWHAASSTWKVLQMDSTGYPLPSTGRIEGDTNSDFPAFLPYPDPQIVDDPDLLHQIPTGDYGVCYTLHTAHGESLPSQVAHFESDGPGAGGPFTTQAQVPVSTLPLSGPLPAPYTAISWYIVPFPGFTPPEGAVGRFAHVTTNDPVYVTDGDATAPPESDITAGPRMRLLADGDTLDVVLPFATLDTAPDVLLGKDPDTALPAYCPPPRQKAVTTDTDIDPPTATDDCVQVRCGVALALRASLEETYDFWANAINWAAKLAIGLSVTALLAELTPLVLVLELAWATQILRVLGPVLQSAGLSAIPSLAPVLTSDELEHLLESIFCPLPCEGGTVQLAPTHIAAWASTIAANPDWFSNGFQPQLLGWILQYRPFQEWEAIASAAALAPSALCDGISCG